MMSTFLRLRKLIFKPEKKKRHCHLTGTLFHVTGFISARNQCFVTTYMLIFIRCSQSGQYFSVNY